VAPLRLSIVIPTYNRRELLPAAVDSALAWLDRIGDGEIVVVDDGSTDGTGQMLAARYRGEIARGRIACHRRGRNGGVAAARNSGAALARGEWLVCLDSDDVLIEDSAPAVAEALDRAGAAPILFFRCVDMASGALIGAPLAAPLTMDLAEHLHRWRWAECLAIVRAGAARSFPFVEELRGYEAVAHYRINRALGPIIVDPTIARRYRREGADRVSAAGPLSRGIRKRIYVRLMLREFRRELSARLRARLLLTYVRSRLDYWSGSLARLLGPAR
jgi:glycosyltransferase involved in cell wall biosynthesis